MIKTDFSVALPTCLAILIYSCMGRAQAWHVWSWAHILKFSLTDQYLPMKYVLLQSVSTMHMITLFWDLCMIFYNQLSAMYETNINS